MKRTKVILLAMIFGILAACGGGNEGYGGGSGTPPGETPPPGGQEVEIPPPPPGETSADYAISISIPETDAIRKLPGDAAGVYSLTGTLTVTDRNGNPVPAGTVVNLDVIDTIKAIGTINHADANENITGTTLIDSNPTLANGTTPITFESAFVMRDGSPRMIDANDLVLLTNNAFQTDMNRFISDAAGAITGNTITVSSGYSANYATSIFANPAHFDPTETSYLIGSSEMGIKIHGIDPKDSAVTTPALAQTDKNGIAKFRIEYPANSGTIHMGCSVFNDERFDVAGSASVYMVARLDDNDTVTTLEHDQLCYKSILPWSLTIVPQATIAGNGNFYFEITVEDAEKVNLPYIEIDAMSAVTTRAEISPGPPPVVSNIDIQATGCISSFDGTGTCTATITVTNGISGDTGEVTFYSGTAKAETIQIKIP